MFPGTVTAGPDKCWDRRAGKREREARKWRAAHLRKKLNNLGYPNLPAAVVWICLSLPITLSIPIVPFVMGGGGRELSGGGYASWQKGVT